jgi:hypothetical protein
MSVDVSCVALGTIPVGSVGGFQSMGGTPSYHPCIDGSFHEINHPAIGVPLMETLSRSSKETGADGRDGRVRASILSPGDGQG